MFFFEMRKFKNKYQKAEMTGRFWRFHRKFRDVSLEIEK